MAQKCLKILLIIMIGILIIRPAFVSAADGSEKTSASPYAATVDDDSDFTCRSRNVRNAVNIIATVLLWARILIPVFIIISAMVSYFKAVMSQDDDIIRDVFKKLLQKIAIGVAIVFIPTIVIAIAKKIGSYQTTDPSWVYCIDLLK